MSVSNTDFKGFGLPEPLVEDLTRVGFLSPTPIQAQGIPTILSGHDLLAIAPTGTGKTGAFGIPALNSIATQKEKQVLILAPTRELAAQIYDFIKSVAMNRGVRGALLIGGENFRRQFFMWHSGSDFIVATPGRLMDHVRRGLDLSHVGMLIFDEVDRMFDMGFAPQVEEILKLVPTERQTLFFSATMPPEIQQLAQRHLKNPAKITVGGKVEDEPKIREEKVQVYGYKKFEVLLEQCVKHTGKILVFTKTKFGADQVADKLEEGGIRAARLHGDRRQTERKRALQAFRDGTVRVMVATDIASRGIDVTDIETVINFDRAATREDHLHRIGRTGRYGKEGLAITFVDGKSQGKRPQGGGRFGRKQFGGFGGKPFGRKQRDFGDRGSVVSGFKSGRNFHRERDEVTSPQFGKMLAKSEAAESGVVAVEPGAPQPHTFEPRRKNFGGKRFGERKPFEKRPFGERKRFGDRRPFGDRKPFGDREQKPFRKNVERDFQDFREKKRSFREKQSLGHSTGPKFPKQKREVHASTFAPKRFNAKKKSGKSA